MPSQVPIASVDVSINARRCGSQHPYGKLLFQINIPSHACLANDWQSAGLIAGQSCCFPLRRLRTSVTRDEVRPADEVSARISVRGDGPPRRSRRTGAPPYPRSADRCCGSACAADHDGQCPERLRHRVRLLGYRVEPVPYDVGRAHRCGRSRRCHVLAPHAAKSAQRRLAAGDQPDDSARRHSRYCLGHRALCPVSQCPTRCINCSSPRQWQE